ncbi:hypothetical protein SH1V18_04760 [Vallitalea longa]|uniref:Tetratricopeptide repeat protein n=1 Tax=Vallitalea longa TaxID=2936439 RepID=A0A9W5Y8J1_9FIRM|nr:tetratricopeptide repeat protein [Vallitalea longa]GKX27996.1 hypothetical protein SH1V18_04760 [Vallitalea longa]
MSKLCPKCGSDLNDDYICTNCGSKIDVYNKIKLTSRLLYNQGLQVAKLRDLSGAISLLKRSLKLDKNNIDAHNLLGLVYFEIGEVVPALQQWVISKNIQEEDNIADYYIEKIHHNQHKLDMINTAIKKYNQSLRYIEQKSEDLAIIQLKKVISLNPNFVKAYCLLALCYIHEDNLAKAKINLLKVLTIDKSNYVALKYYEEIISQDTEDKKEDIYSVDKKEDPFSVKKTTKKESRLNPAMLQFGYVVFGVVIGLLVAVFLIVPGRVKSKTNEADNLKKEILSQQNEYDTLLTSLTNEKDELKIDLDEKNGLLVEFEGKATNYDALGNLISAVALYLENEDESAANKLYLVKPENLVSSTSIDLYNKIRKDTYPQIAKKAFDQGSKLYSRWKNNNKDEYLVNAITSFQTATKFVSNDASYADDMLYYEARCQQLLGHDKEALALFNKLLDNYPNSSFKTWSKQQVDKLE